MPTDFGDPFVRDLLGTLAVVVFAGAVGGAVLGWLIGQLVRLLGARR